MLVIASDRTKVEQEEIPDFFTPVTGKWNMKCKFPVLCYAVCLGALTKSDLG